MSGGPTPRCWCCGVSLYEPGGGRWGCWQPKAGMDGAGAYECWQCTTALTGVDPRPPAVRAAAAPPAPAGETLIADGRCADCGHTRELHQTRCCAYNLDSNSFCRCESFSAPAPAAGAAGVARPRTECDGPDWCGVCDICTERMAQDAAESDDSVDDPATAGAADARAREDAELLDWMEQHVCGVVTRDGSGEEVAHAKELSGDDQSVRDWLREMQRQETRVRSILRRWADRTARRAAGEVRA